MLIETSITQWTIGNNGYVIFQLESTGGALLTAIGYGSFSGTREFSPSVINLENEYAAFSFKESDNVNSYVTKVHLDTS